MSLHRRIESIDYAPYLESERRSPIKHELIHGELFAMTGGTVRHDLIKNNAIGELCAHLKNSPCLVLGSDTNLRVARQQGYNGYYPDVLVCCDPSDNHADYRERPLVIIEVLFNTTKTTDKTLKKSDYFRISTLSEYLLIDQDTVEVTIFRRMQDAWEEETSRAKEMVRLVSIGFECRIEDFYAKVAWN
ncbi:MAG: Uma2 family endonuclease [Methylococcales bacterium]